MPRFRMDAMLNLARTHLSPYRGRIPWLAIIETAKTRTRLPFLRFDSGNPNPEECGTRLGARDPRGILGARLPSRIVPEPESASGSCVQDSSAPSSLRFPQDILPRWVRFTTQAQNRSFGRQPFEARCFTAGRARQPCRYPLGASTHFRAFADVSAPCRTRAPRFYAPLSRAASDTFRALDSPRSKSFLAHLGFRAFRKPPRLLSRKFRAAFSSPSAPRGPTPPEGFSEASRHPDATPEMCRFCLWGMRDSRLAPRAFRDDFASASHVISHCS